MTTALPRQYQVWLGGALASQLGDTLLYFALGWAATAHGGTFAGLVLTAINLPRAGLLLVGGVVGDRLGARRVMIAGDAAMLIVTLTLAVLAGVFGTPLWLLIPAGFLIGTVDAFCLPASGAMPRRMVGRAQLPRALALRQTGSQVIALIGAPLGGLLVVVVGLAGTALADALTFSAVLVVLTRISETRDPEVRRNAAVEAFDGIKIAARDAVLRPALILTAGAAGFLLPVSSLLIPLLARAHHWPAASAGWIVGAQSCGMLLVAAVVARSGQLHRPGLVAAGAVGLAAFGVLALAVLPTFPLVLASAVVVGLGSGLFSTHIGPLLLGSAPASHLSRVQALVTLVQSVALLATNNVLGSLSSATALLTSACVLGLAALLGLANPALRHV